MNNWTDHNQGIFTQNCYCYGMILLTVWIRQNDKMSKKLILISIVSYEDPNSD